MNLGFDFLGGFLTLGSRGLRGFQNFRDSVIDIFFGSDFFPLSLPVFLIWGDTFFFGDILEISRIGIYPILFFSFPVFPFLSIKR